MGIEPTRALPLVSSAIMRVWQLMGPNNECGIIDACSRSSKSSCSYCGSGRDYTSRRPAARRPGRGDPDAASAARLIRGTRCEAAANRSRHPDHTSVALAILRLAQRPGGGAPRDDDPLAPGRLAAVLAPEVSTPPTADPEAITGSDPPHGKREPFMGRGTHRQ